MRTSQFLALALVIATSFAAGVQPATQPSQNSQESVVFRKTLESGVVVSVVKGPLQTIPDMKELTPNRKNWGVSGVYTISVQVTAPGADPVTFGSRVYPEYIGQLAGGVEVLDCMVAPKRFIFVSAEGPDLLVWEVRILGLNNVKAAGIPNSWSARPDARGLAHTGVTAKLSKIAVDSDKLQVEVTDARADPPKITKFQQRDDEWKFALVEPTQQ